MAADEPAWHLMSLAGYAMEEMRIERYAVALDYPPSAWIRPSNLEDALFFANGDVVLAVTDEASSNLDHLMRGIIGVFDRLTEILGYLAAPVLAGTGALPLDELTPDGRANWDDYVAATWDRRLQL